MMQVEAGSTALGTDNLTIWSHPKRATENVNRNYRKLQNKCTSYRFNRVIISKYQTIDILFEVVIKKPRPNPGRGEHT